MKFSHNSRAIHLTSFNPVDFGAIGDGVHDDTMAIRQAIVLAIVAGPGSEVFIPNPPNFYTGCPQASDPTANIFRPVFSLSTGITIRGESPNTTIKFFFDGLLDPVTHWHNINSGSFKIQRGTMFQLNSGGQDFVIKNLTLDGGAGYTGVFTKGGVQSTGDGWDMTHKCIQADGSASINSITIEDCKLKNWRGEIVYTGGTSIAAVHINRCVITSSNGSSVSCSTNLTITDTIIGGLSSTDRVYNGIECYSMNDTQGVTIANSCVQCGTSFADRRGNGVSWTGGSGAALKIFDSTIAYCNYGILYQDAANDVEIDNVQFIGCTSANITSTLNLYPITKGFSNIHISNSSIDGGYFFNNQTGHCKGFNFDDIDIKVGSLLTGKWNTPSDDFKIDGCIFHAGSRDVTNYSGTTTALWTNSKRTYPWVNTTNNKLDNFSNISTLVLNPASDQCWLNANTVPCRVTLDTTRFRPVGFTTRVNAWSSKLWTLALDTDILVPMNEPVGILIQWDGTQWNRIQETEPVYPDCPLGSITDKGIIADTSVNIPQKGIYWYNYWPIDNNKYLVMWSPDHDTSAGGGVFGGIVDHIGDFPATITMLVAKGTYSSGSRTMADFETPFRLIKLSTGKWRMYAHGQVINGKVPGLTSGNVFQETHYFESDNVLGPYLPMGPAIPNQKGPQFCDWTHTGYPQVFPPLFFGPKQVKWFAHSLGRDAYTPPQTVWSESVDGTNFSLPQNFLQTTDRFTGFPPSVVDANWCRGAWFKASNNKWYCVGCNRWQDGYTIRTAITIFEVDLDEFDRPIKPTGRFWRLIEATGDFPSLNYIQDVQGIVECGNLHLFILRGFYDLSGREQIQWLTLPVS